MRRLNRPRDVVVDCCAAMCSKGKARMLRDQRRRFSRCGVESELLTAAEADLVLGSVS